MENKTLESTIVLLSVSAVLVHRKVECFLFYLAIPLLSIASFCQMALKIAFYCYLFWSDPFQHTWALMANWMNFTIENFYFLLVFSSLSCQLLKVFAFYAWKELSRCMKNFVVWCNFCELTRPDPMMVISRAIFTCIYMKCFVEYPKTRSSCTPPEYYVSSWTIPMTHFNIFGNLLVYLISLTIFIISRVFSMCLYSSFLSKTGLVAHDFKDLNIKHACSARLYQSWVSPSMGILWIFLVKWSQMKI